MDRAHEIGAVGEHTQRVLAEKHAARETMLASSREAIRACAIAIRAVHRRSFDEARGHLDRAAEVLQRARDATEGHPDVRYSGSLNDAHKEYVEANLTLAFVAGTAMPGPDELDAGVAPYLGGMAEAASELRRQVLDCLRRGELDEAERLFAVMDEVYALLVTIDYPDALTGGLRRTTDALRAVLERTRGDVTNAHVAARLREAIEGTAQR